MAGTRPTSFVASPGHDGVGSRDNLAAKTRFAPLPSSKRWRNRPRTTSLVMPGLVPGIHVLCSSSEERRMAGASN